MYTVLTTAINYIQLESGVVGNLLEYDYIIYGNLSINLWITLLWEET